MKTAISLILALVPPILTAFVMASPESLRVAVPYLLCVVYLARRGTLRPRPATRSRTESAVTFLLAVGALVVLVRVLILPQELYSLWFRSDSGLRSSTAVSRIFVMVVTVPSAAIAAGVFRRGIPAALSAATLLIVAVSGIALAEPVLLATSLPVAFVTALMYQHTRGRIVAQAIAFLLALSLALPWLAVEEPRGNSVIDDVVSPWLRTSLVRRFPRLGLDTGFGMFNTQFDTRNLAGRASLSERQIMEIEGRSGERVYLRTGVFDVYTGNSWERSARMQQAGGGEGTGLVRDFPPRGNELRITFLTELFEAVPHTLTTRHLSFPDRETRIPLIGRRDTGFRFSAAPRPGETIVLHEGLREAALRIRTTGTYLHVPDDIPQRVRERADAIAREARGDTELAVELLLSYLTDGYRYTLDTDPSRYGRDFVESFLFDTREGYCVHFATSFVVLARLLDIPARYVTGFLVPMPDQQDDEETRVTKRISGLSAHAWPEIWVDNRGWTIVEATPPMRTGDGSAWAGSRESGQDGRTARQLSELGIASEDTLDTLEGQGAGTATEGATAPDSRSAPDVAGDTDRGRPRALVWVASVIATAASAAAAPALRRTVHHARARRRSPEEYTDWCLGELIRCSAGLGLRAPGERGYEAWGRSLAAQLPRARECVGRTVRDAQALVYGGTVPGPRSRRRMLLTARRCRRERRRLLWQRVHATVFPGKP
ncbi:MAG: transglutaminase-like domain-containing protein [Spirochaetaceae bacterium]